MASVSAELERLKRQMRNLESQQKTLVQEQEAAQRQQEAAYNNKVRDLRQKMEAARKHADAESRRRVQELEGRLREELSRNVRELQEIDRQFHQQSMELQEELRKVNAELRRNLEDIRTRERRKTEQSRQAAERRTGEALAQAEKVAAMPHDFFHPGQLNILREHLNFAQTLIHEGMCDAALATADMALTEMEILAIQVEESQREWEEIYRIYQQLIFDIHQSMENFENERVQVPYGECQMTEKERLIWSCGQYGPIRRDIEHYYDMAKDVEQSGGITAFLNAGKGERRIEIEQKIRRLHRLSDQLEAVKICIRSERFFSDQRVEMGDTAQETLSQMGCHILSAGFRDEPDAFDASRPAEELTFPLNCYEVAADLQNKIDKVKLTIVPERKDGVAVRNRGILTIDVRTMPEERLIRDVAETIRSKLSASVPNVLIDWYRADDRRISESEQHYMRQPDVELQTRKLERKYAAL